jgi:N-acetylmuramoyl-L-alanine amidase CwlA
MVNIIQDFIPEGRVNRPGRANPTRFITVHNTGNANKGANAKAHAGYLKNVGEKISYHYSVDDKEIYQHLPDSEDAYHAGDGSGDGNRKSIGIEICMNQDGGLLAATDNAAWLVAKLMSDHNIQDSNVVQHNHWSGKDCPQLLRAGKPYPWHVFISKALEFKKTEGNKGLAEEVRGKYGFTSETMAYLAAYKYADDLLRKFLNPEGQAYQLGTINYINAYRYGVEIWKRVETNG